MIEKIAAFVIAVSLLLLSASCASKPTPLARDIGSAEDTEECGVCNGLENGTSKGFADADGSSSSAAADGVGRGKQGNGRQGNGRQDEKRRDEERRDEERQSATAMSIDFRNKKLGRVLKKIEKVSKMKILAPREVEEREVTVKFTSTPWDEILDSLLRANGLGYVSDGKTIEVAPITRH